MKRRMVLIVSLFCCTWMTASTHAQSTWDIWFTTIRDPNAPRVTSVQTTPNGVFELSLWMQGPVTARAVEACVGWLTTDTLAQNAIPQSGQLALDGTLLTAVDVPLWGYHYVMTGGFYSATPGLRPWGLRLAHADSVGFPAVNPLRIASIRFRAAGLQRGQSADIVLWNGGDAPDWTTFVAANIDDVYRPATQTVRVFIPGATLSGTVSLQDYTFRPSVNVPAEVTLRNQSGGVDTQTITLTSTGAWSVTTSLTGPLTVLVKATHWLRAAVSNVDISSGTAVVNFNLINGDADGDNAVTLFDYLVLDGQFGSADAMADLDGDGAVTLFDYLIIDRNFGATGA